MDEVRPNAASPTRVLQQPAESGRSSEAVRTDRPPFLALAESPPPEPEQLALWPLAPAGSIAALAVDH
jgi:hypothetical protein